MTLNGDEDSDGVSDAMEVIWGTDPYDSHSVPELPAVNHVGLLIVAVVLLLAAVVLLHNRRALARHTS